METLQTKRGDTFRRAFFFTDSAGVALPLTGCTARFAAKAKGETAVAFYAPQVGAVPGGTLDINEAEGEILVLIAAEIMDDVEPGAYLADIEVTWPSGDVISTETFQIKVVEDITT